MNAAVLARRRLHTHQADGIARWFGLAAWVVAMVAVSAPLQERILLLAPLVIVPALLGVLPSRPIGRGVSTRDFAGAPALIAALPLILAATQVRGPIAGAIALPWLVLAVVVAVAGIADGLRSLPAIVAPARASDLVTDAAMAALAVGAAWLLADRAGVPVMGFVAPIATLTAVHFHFAAFGLVSVAGLVAPTRPGRLAWVAIIGLITGTGITAIGFLLPTSPANLVGALMVGGSGLVIAFLVASVLWGRRDRSLVPAWIAVGCLTVGMLMALAWAVSLASSVHAHDVELMVESHALDLDVMVRTHGSLNATAVLLLAWTARSWVRGPGQGRPGLPGPVLPMRSKVRAVPWMLALAGLAIPLVASGFELWPFVLAWLVVLALAWLVGGAMLPSRSNRIAAAVVLLPALVLLAFEGGWWLIPADLAWLVIEIVDTGPRRAHADVVLS